MGRVTGTTSSNSFRKPLGGAWTILPAPAGTKNGEARDIDASGNACGVTASGGPSQAMYWPASGGYVSIGKLPGFTDAFALAMNDQGTVVGNSINGPTYHAFMWDMVGGIVDLNSRLDASASGYVLQGGLGINNAGEICGWGTYHGQSIGYIARPVVPVTIRIAGNVQLQDWYGPVDQVEVTVSVFTVGDTTPLQSVKAQLDASGHFDTTFPTKMAAGDYDVRIRGPHWLSRLRSSQALSANLGANQDADLINGDVDGDDVVTVFDYAALSNYFDKSSGDPDWATVGGDGFAPRDADVDGDEAVTVFDYSVLSGNFDRSGE